MSKSPPWTKQDEFILLQGVSTYGLSWFCRKTGRSLAAVRAKANRMFGSASLTRGAYTLREAERWTGYDETQLRRAQAALRQKWKRTSPHGSFLIYEEQLEELVQWLKTDYWNIQHRLYGCLWCDTTSRPHYAMGLCQRCYNRYVQRLRRTGLPAACAALLEVARGNQDLLGDLVAEIERELQRGRALRERLLAQLIQEVV